MQKIKILRELSVQGMNTREEKMEVKDFSKSKIVKVNCSFCSKEMECPEEMLEKSKKHMCHECFYDRLEKGNSERLEDVHVDIPKDELIADIAGRMTDELVEKVFHKIWAERKHELKDSSKKDIAYHMFGTGAHIALGNIMWQQHQNFVKADKDEMHEHFKYEPVSVIGLPFYTEADWQIQCGNSVEDSGFKDYEEMREHHEKLKKNLEALGHNVRYVQINAAEMQEHFRSKGLENNQLNRSAYVADILRKND